MGTIMPNEIFNVELEDVEKGIRKQKAGDKYGNINKPKTTSQYEFEQNKPKPKPEESRTDFLHRLCQQI